MIWRIISLTCHVHVRDAQHKQGLRPGPFTGESCRGSVREYLRVQENLHSEAEQTYRAILPSQLPPRGCPEIWSLLDLEPQQGTLARSQSNQQWPEPDLQDAALQKPDCTL